LRSKYEKSVNLNLDYLARFTSHPIKIPIHISERYLILVWRRHAATYASRSGVPIEIISKIILRHSNLSTTERYLGKISDVEAMKWIDNLHA
jgi:hypothetical protein